MSKNLYIFSYPKLHSWLIQMSSSPDQIETVFETFLFKIAQILTHVGQSHGELWTQELKWLALVTVNNPSTLDDSIELAARLDFDLLLICSLLTEAAVARGLGPSIYQELKKISPRTKNLSFHFLTAWTAFNCDFFNECIIDCEPILERNSDVYLLCAQAHLHLSDVSPALELLNVATCLAPNEPTGWFLLAKSNFVYGNLVPAREAIETCLNLAPYDLEAIIIALFIASDPKCSQDDRLILLDRSKHVILSEKTPFYCLLNYLEAALLSESNQWITDILAKHAKIGKKYTLESPTQAKQLALILRTLGLRQDYQNSKLLLDCVLNKDSSYEKN